MLTELDIYILNDLDAGKSKDEVVTKYGEPAEFMYECWIAEKEDKEKREREMTGRQKLIATYGEQRIKDFEDTFLGDLEGEELKESMDAYTKKYVEEDIKNGIKTVFVTGKSGKPEIIRGRVH